MNARTTLKTCLAGAAAAAIALFGVAAPAHAGEWLYGEKNCTSSGQYVGTSGTGTGDITHYHRAMVGGGSATMVAYHGGTRSTQVKTATFGWTSAASVAGGGATYSTILCG